MEREQVLAKTLLKYSCSLKEGDTVLIQASVEAKSLVCELTRKAFEMGVTPIVFLSEEGIERCENLYMTEKKAKKIGEYFEGIFKDVNASIRIKTKNNIFEQEDVPIEKLGYLEKYYFDEKFGPLIINKKPWVLLSYPTAGMAQSAKMSTERFIDFYFNVCNLSYSKMKEAMIPLKELMERTDKVRITSPGTDLTFSIKGMSSVICAGESNIPDGEIFTAPVRESVTGKITYNIPSLYKGKAFNRVCFEFAGGKIIKECAGEGEEFLSEILNVDEGARYIGEFAIGVNPFVMEPIRNILFDEKMCGSIHITPGECYEEANNGNKSKEHWDLVLCQREEFGGGEIFFDGVLVRKNGNFVLPSLLGLNPENLKE